MQYRKIISGNVIIEIHNSWKGIETVYANGQVVSQKGSFWGTNHPFTVLDAGKEVHFILTTKVSSSGTGVVLDLSRNGRMVAADLSLPYGSRPNSPHLKLKKSGLKKLKEYDLECAMEDFLQAVELNPDDPELYFYMACIHSVSEHVNEAFSLLAEAVARGLKDTKLILTHDMLAYIRLHPVFENFRASDFTKVDTAYLKVVEAE